MNKLRNRIVALIAVALAVFALAVTAPTAADAAVAIAPSSPTYVARLAGSNAFIAIVKGDGEARAYVCDGEGISAWFAGPAIKGAFAASAESLQLDAVISSTKAKGVITFADGTRHAFTAPRTAKTGKAGLYRGETTIADAKYVGGWIVLPNGDVRGYVEQDNLAVPFAPTGNGIIAILIGRRSVDLTGVGTLSITDGTSNIRR